MADVLSQDFVCVPYDLPFVSGLNSLRRPYCPSAVRTAFTKDRPERYQWKFGPLQLLAIPQLKWNLSQALYTAHHIHLHHVALIG